MGNTHACEARKRSDNSKGKEEKKNTRNAKVEKNQENEKVAVQAARW